VRVGIMIKAPSSTEYMLPVRFAWSLVDICRRVTSIVYFFNTFGAKIKLTAEEVF
jgi:hypothetical protein